MVDAQNAARALMANPGLPVFRLGAQQRELQELTAAQRKLSQQLQAHKATLAALESTSAVRAVIEAVVKTLGEQLKVLEKQLRTVVISLVPELLDVQGVGSVVAGIVLGEMGQVERFKDANRPGRCRSAQDEHHFASYCGAAPVEQGSGQNRRMQLNTAGNRRLNWALHIVAIVRLRQDDRTKTLFAKLKERGKSQRTALRILKTYIARELFRLLRQAASGMTTGSPEGVPDAA